MLTLILLLACAPVEPELDIDNASCLPFRDMGADLVCGESGAPTWFCAQGDGCWYTDGEGISVPVRDCRDRLAIADAQQELVDRCGGMD